MLRGSPWYACARRPTHSPSVPRPKITTEAFLSRVPLFEELATEELQRIAAGTTELHVPRGEIIFNRGDPCVGFHLVVYGQVKLAFVSPQGGEKVVEIVAPGFSFGEALMFMGKPYIVMAQTLADSMLLHVSKKVVSIINLTSVAELEAAAGAPVNPLRFRGNLHVRGWPAWHEFSLLGAEIAIGRQVQLKVVKRITRCAATEVDPDTAIRDLPIPRTILDTYGHMDCGIYAEVLGGAAISEGDRIERTSGQRDLF